MKPALAIEDLASLPARPELVTTEPVPSQGPEQLLLRMLEVVRDRVEAIHSSQRVLTVEVRDIRKNLPQQRRPVSKRTEEVHIRATWARRNGLCPCCQDAPVCDATGRIGDAEIDHWYSRNQNRVTQTWIVCRTCNANLNNTDFKAAARSAFESYQQALRPFLGVRQFSLPSTSSSIAQSLTGAV